MSYKYETQFTSGNATPGSQVYATWGRGRTIEAIAIHWWGDPNQNPSYENTVSYLCRDGGTSSAHLVATGTGRRVAQLVDFGDAAWATNSANPYTIAIECDPRCRDEDYDVVAELIAQIRDAFGDLPLVPHKQFVATACPGNYDLGRLDRLARTKDGSGEWGTVTSKNKITRDQIASAYLEVLERPYDEGGMNTYLNSGFDINKIKSEMRASKEYADLQKRKQDAANQPKPVPTPIPEPTTPPVIVPEAPSEPAKVGLDESSTTLLQDVKKLLEWLKTWLEARFK